MKLLVRRKLDVANKTPSNIFGWRGPFTPEFVAACGRGLHAISQKRILWP